MCFAADDLSASSIKNDPLISGLTEAYTIPPNDNQSKSRATSPTILSPAPSPTNAPAKAVAEVNGTSPDRKSSPEPKTSEPASESTPNINSTKNNNKHVEELYDIPVGKYSSTKSVCDRGM